MTVSIIVEDGDIETVMRYDELDSPIGHVIFSVQTALRAKQYKLVLRFVERIIHSSAEAVNALDELDALINGAKCKSHKFIDTLNMRINGFTIYSLDRATLTKLCEHIAERYIG